MLAYPIAQRIPISLPVAHRKQDGTPPLLQDQQRFSRVNPVFYISQAAEQFHL